MQTMTPKNHAESESLVLNESLRLELLRELPDKFFCTPFLEDFQGNPCWNIGFGGIRIFHHESLGGWLIAFSEYSNRTFWGVDGRETRLERKPSANPKDFEELKKILIEYYQS